MTLAFTHFSAFKRWSLPTAAKKNRRLNLMRILFAIK